MSEQPSDQKLRKVEEIIDSEREESLLFLAELHKSPQLTQRELAAKLNISLGKTNYLIRELIKKGMLKVKSFSHKPNKVKKIKYILTKKGLEGKIKLTYHFLKRKEAEYNHIKSEWEKLTANQEQINSSLMIEQSKI